MIYKLNYKILIILSFIAGTVSNYNHTSAYVGIPIGVEAAAAYVYDIKAGEVIWSKNAEAQLPLASLTKLMTVYSYHKESIGKKDLSCFILTTSSNEQAEKIENLLPIGVQTLNSYATKLKLNQTFYINATGLDISENLSGAYGSAFDQATIMKAFYYEFPELLSCTTKELATLGSVERKNTNPYVANTIGLIASKTGFTDLAGGNLAVIIDAEIGKPVIIIILGSTEKGRFSDVEIITQSIRENMMLKSNIHE